jgi:predicted MFS family arabinose efflux permease
VSLLSRTPALAPFKGRDFRRLWAGDLLTSWAFEMENIILPWYILVETKDVRLLALYGSLIYLGTLISPMFGVAGDRIGHRNLLSGMRVSYACLATVLAGLALAGLLTPLLVLCVAAFIGLVRPSDLGVRAALVSAIVPRGQLMSASSLARMTVESARITGALVGAALVAAFGMAHAYLVIIAFYLVGALCTLGVAPAPPRPLERDVAGVEIARPSPWSDLKEGILYVWHAPHLLACMCIAFMANLTAYPMSNGLLPYVAREVYHIDQTGLSYLVAGFAGGGLIGSLILSLMGGAARAGRMTLVFAAIWYVMLFFFARMPTPASGFILLMCAGACQTLSLVSLTVLLLRTTDERYRGRVMGVRMLAIYGLPVGLMAAGELISRFGFIETATFYAIFGIVSIALISWRWWAHLWPREAPANG